MFATPVPSAGGRQVQTFRFNPSIGQRYVYRQEGAPDSIWTLTAIGRPLTIAQLAWLTFTEELTQRVFRRSAAHLAQDILDGHLRDLQASPLPTTGRGTVALSNLLATMKPNQLRTYKTRVSYVLELDRACVGQSHKSLEFVRVIETFHRQRMDAWMAQAAENPGKNIEPIESEAPAPTTVYRWFLRYRKAGNDLYVLALSVLVARTRTPRKPKEKALLAAFLASRMAFVERETVAQMTADFNRLLAKTDPLHIDTLIDQLHAQAVETAQANKRARSGKTSMSSKRRQAESAMAKASHAY